MTETVKREVGKAKARLKAAIIKKHGSLYAASKSIGRPVTYVQGFFYQDSLQIKTLFSLSKLADVSPRYILQGGGKKKWTGESPSFDNLIKAFDDFKGKRPQSLAVIVRGLKTGKREGFTLATLYAFSEVLCLYPSFLIGINGE